MSGFGERFRREGYRTPKPLLMVDEKPIIAHIVDLFPGDHDFVFICNADHLAQQSWGLASLLKSLGKSVKIISIAPHKLGPVNAILQARAHLDHAAPTIVNYADFSCRWDFNLFLQDIAERSLSGSVPAYRGFHPHSGGSTNYAYILEENLTLKHIQEKQPFTENKVDEFASSGTYYFETAELMLELFDEQVQEDLSVAGEFYVSTSMELMSRRGLAVGVYELDFFMQWGTPKDFEEYQENTQLFRELAKISPKELTIEGTGPALILASGAGRRFSAGYRVPKSLLPVSGKPVVSQVARTLEPDSFVAVSVANDLACAGMRQQGFDNILRLGAVSDGQATSAKMLVNSYRGELTQHFTIFPCDLISTGDTGALGKYVGGGGNFLVVWARRPTRFCIENPEQFGWVWVEEETVMVAIKEPPSSVDAKVLTGAFTFSSTEVFDSLSEALDREGLTVKGEPYLDSFIGLAAGLNIRVAVFDPTINISLGTPHEYETFRYWQRCFNGWETHPYSLSNDPFFMDGRNLELPEHPGQT